MSGAVEAEVLLSELRHNIEVEAVEVFDSTVLPKLVKIAMYTLDDVSGSARVTSSDEDIMAGRVYIEYSLVYANKHPDPFQVAQRIILESLLANLLARK